MTQLNFQLPILGQGNASEDPKIHDALAEIQTVVNGELGKDNVTGGGWRFDDILAGPTGLAVCSFHARRSTNQSIPAGASNTVIFDSETFDLSNVYAATSGNFQPTVSGIYRVSAVVQWANFTGFARTDVNKSGAFYATLAQNAVDPTTSGMGLGGSTLVSLNGTTDFVTIAALNGDGTTAHNVTGGFFCAELVGRN